MGKYAGSGELYVSKAYKISGRKAGFAVISLLGEVCKTLLIPI